MTQFNLENGCAGPGSDRDERRMLETTMKNNNRQLARTAHDVRHLCVCEGCKELADDRDTVNAFHPKCFYEARGAVGVLALSSDDQGKFRMCDLPVDVLKKLWR